MSQVQIFVTVIGFLLMASRSSSISESDLKHYFYNQANPSKGIQTDISNSSDVARTSFSPQKDTFFYVHGWNDYYTSNKTVQKVKNALLKKYDVNFFVLDWSSASNKTFYFISILQTRKVGKFLGDLMEKFAKTGGLDFNKTTLCGHSLGAHVAGIAGTYLGGRLHQVVGLDPTSILLTGALSLNPISKSSGQFVEIIHTNALVYGYSVATGHADYYVNGGWVQIAECDIGIVQSCSHLIAIDYYAESLLTGNFIANNCLVSFLFFRGFCNKASYMGEYQLDRNLNFNSAITFIHLTKGVLKGMSQVHLVVMCIGFLLAYSESYFVSELDLTHYFYNQANPLKGIRTDISNASDVAQAGFSPQKDTFFYVHGWNDYYTSTKTAQKVKNAVLKKYDVNFFAFDWSLASNNTFYLISFLQTERVGRFLADLMEKFANTGKLDFNRTTLCGHSLGAHVAGVAGNYLGGRLYQVVGLDPTSILFTPLITSNRIAKSSGQFVEIVHTNGLVSGYILPSGHADYYVNGGWLQIPSCGIDLIGGCSHLIAIDYYAESLLTGNFKANNCLVNILFFRGFCKEASYMGEYHLDRRARGSYFLDTNAKSPFAKG
ncbi:uncharacterized protein [Diabrotica undecimpunctata]|uniref:uncharacterized protein n=1 Tax=Diabrotica undecimpunctata TaxID=50387 RepID=UPI003B63421E